jgi:lipoprotein-anchoring transpeptidase ErfK/SrfK
MGAMMKGFARPTLIGALATLACVAALTRPASAQLFWDWGGGQESDGSGRETVRFAPRFTAGQIIVSFGDRRLYLITSAGEAISYPIAIPREQDRWQGVTKVSDKKINPPWRPTPDMLAENPRLPSWVPGGHPMNPLGVRALYLGSSSYRIHGTDAPWTIGTAASKGCIRMYNRDVLDLYPRVPIGTKVTVTWERFNDASYSVSAGEAPAPRLPAMRPADLPRGDMDEWAY